MEPLLADLFRLRGGGAAAVHLVLGPTPTLIDAGAPGRGPAIEAELRRAGVAIRRIALTHGDPDHAGGSDHLRRAFGAEVLAPRLERPLIDRSGWPGLPARRRLIMRTFWRASPAPVIDGWFDDGADLDGLAVVGTPGHTPGHVAYEWRRWLLAGDALVSGGRCRESLSIFTLDLATARRSIEGLARREPVGLSSSHGRPVDRAAERLTALVATWS